MRVQADEKDKHPPTEGEGDRLLCAVGFYQVPPPPSHRQHQHFGVDDGLDDLFFRVRLEEVVEGRLVAAPSPSQAVVVAPVVVCF